MQYAEGLLAPDVKTAGWLTSKKNRQKETIVKIIPSSYTKLKYSITTSTIMPTTNKVVR